MYHKNNITNNNIDNDLDININKKTKAISDLCDEEKTIYELVTQKPCTIEYIIENIANSSKSSNQLLSYIVLLESK